LLSFLQKEFHNFTREEDKEFFIKIIEEIKNEKKTKENISNIPPLIKKDIDYEEKIIWKEDKYSNYLNLGKKYGCCHHHAHRFFKSEQEILYFPELNLVK